LNTETTIERINTDRDHKQDENSSIEKMEQSQDKFGASMSGSKNDTNIRMS